jgi:hypothetical protein
MKLSIYNAPILLVGALSMFSTAHASAWNCSHTDVVREVVIDYPDGGAVPCNVVYKKAMEGFEDQVLWSAMNEDGYCEQKAREFIVKLESWGWDCVEAASSDFAEAVEDSESNVTSEHEVSPEATPATDVTPEQDVSSEAGSTGETVPEQSVDLPQVESADTNTPVVDKIQ